MVKILLFLYLSMPLGNICTTIIGKEHNDKYYKRINKLGKDVSIDVLTDQPELYKNCNTTEYTREVFSYYEKMMFLLDCVKKYKSRVTHIDVDWFLDLNYDIELKEDTFYTYFIFPYYQMDEKKVRSITNFKLLIQKLNTILSDNGYGKCKQLIGEAFMSMPYLSNFDEMYTRVKTMQYDFENQLNMETGFGARYSKYQNTGVGYGEGMALTMVMDHLNIKYEAIDKSNFYKSRIL